MPKKCEDLSVDHSNETVENNHTREVTICELGRLVLMEYTKREFWTDAIRKIGGVEGLLFGVAKKIL